MNIKLNSRIFQLIITVIITLLCSYFIFKNLLEKRENNHQILVQNLLAEKDSIKTENDGIYSKYLYVISDNKQLINKTNELDNLIKNKDEIIIYKNEIIAKFKEQSSLNNTLQVDTV
ncbi:MAG: hypothetical protein WC934_08380 [Acidithiobacillus sp.]|jgi:hypothetical protein|uniref:hypothetical protein n=1 Tax=Acidithiobacillus sp. TaxID=1872118 RepID=UPI00355E2D6C